MRNNSVIIATNANFLANILKEKLQDAELQVFVAETDNELTNKIKAAFPSLIFLEHCFQGYGTDSFIQKMVKRNRNVRIAVWAVSELKPLAAARFIMAGAESFFSLRGTENHIETILYRIAGGRHYCPADVEAILDKESSCPAIGEELTNREIQVMKLSADGQSNQEVADILSVTVHTVKFHRANIYRKCGGNKAIDILRNGLKRGIFSAEDFQ